MCRRLSTGASRPASSGRGDRLQKVRRRLRRSCARGGRRSARAWMSRAAATRAATSAVPSAGGGSVRSSGAHGAALRRGGRCDRSAGPIISIGSRRRIWGRGCRRARGRRDSRSGTGSSRRRVGRALDSGCARWRGRPRSRRFRAVGGASPALGAEIPAVRRGRGRRDARG